MTEQFTSFFQKNFRFNLNKSTHQYGVLDVRTNRYVDTGTIFSRYSQTMSDLGLAAGVTMEEVTSFVESNTPKDSENEKLPITQFINQWLVANKGRWHMSPAWKEIEYIDNGVTSPKDLESLRADLMLYIFENNIKYGIEEVKTALNVVAMRKQQDALKSMVDNIRYDEKCVEAGERFIRALYDFFKPTEPYEIFAMMFRHWAWQVKRKIWNKDVINHIWLNFMGATNIGKTTALKKITSPMDDFKSTSTISKLFEDTKEIKRLTENYVLIFDELALNVEGEASGALNGDQKATLKSMLTGDKLDTRVYGTQQQSKRKITFSCISSANEHLYDIIFDSTSMRRFYEFHCTASKPSSYEEINKYLDNSYIFWRSIDEERDEGYWDVHSELGKKVIEEQSAYYPTKTTTAMWVRDNHVIAGNIPLSNAYKFYTNWCKETGNKSKTMQNFAADIRHILPGAVKPDGRILLRYDKESSDDDELWEESSVQKSEDLLMEM